MNVLFVKKEKADIDIRKNLVGCRLAGQDITFCKDCINGKKPVCSFLRHILINNMQYKKIVTKNRKELSLYDRAF